MSHLKSIGVDVGVIAKGLNYKVSLNNQRLDDIGGTVSLYATALPYDPVSIGNYGCGCSHVATVPMALDRLAQLRAETQELVAELQNATAGLVGLSTDDGSGRTSFGFADIGRNVIGLADKPDRGLVLDQNHKIISLINRTSAIIEATSGSGIIRYSHINTQWAFD